MDGIRGSLAVNHPEPDAMEARTDRPWVLIITRRDRRDGVLPQHTRGNRFDIERPRQNPCCTGTRNSINRSQSRSPGPGCFTLVKLSVKRGGSRAEQHRKGSQFTMGEKGANSIVAPCTSRLEDSGTSCQAPSMDPSGSETTKRASSESFPSSSLAGCRVRSAVMSVLQYNERDLPALE